MVTMVIQVKGSKLDAGALVNKPKLQATMVGTAAGVLRREGIVGLYSGIGPTLWGILPYAGIKFYVYQALKQNYR